MSKVRIRKQETSLIIDAGNDEDFVLVNQDWDDPAHVPADGAIDPTLTAPRQWYERKPAGIQEIFDAYMAQDRFPPMLACNAVEFTRFGEKFGNLWDEYTDLGFCISANGSNQTSLEKFEAFLTTALEKRGDVIDNSPKRTDEKTCSVKYNWGDACLMIA